MTRLGDYILPVHLSMGDCDEAPRHSDDEHNDGDKDDQHRAEYKSQVTGQAHPIPNDRSEAANMTTISTCGGSRERSRKRDVLSSTANTIAEHLVYARAQRLLLDADHGPVIREHPRAAARREVRIRCGAEDGTSDARYGRQRDAGEHQLRWEPEDRCVFATGIEQVGSARSARGRRSEGTYLRTTGEWRRCGYFPLLRLGLSHASGPALRALKQNTVVLSLRPSRMLQVWSAESVYKQHREKVSCVPIEPIRTIAFHEPGARLRLT